VTIDQWIQLASQGGIGLCTVVALYKVLSSVGERAIAALDRNTDILAAHTKDDVAAQHAVSERLARLESKIESELLFRETTPVDQPPPARGIVGEISGRYRRRGPGGREG